MRRKKVASLRKMPTNRTVESLESQQNHGVIPYDENLLERSRTQWEFGDWQKLARLDRDTLKHHPDRAKLALLAAAGWLQIGEIQNARSFVQLAKDWGCSSRLISQILVAGVHNSLGKALAFTEHQGRAMKHFEKAIEIGMPGGDSKLLGMARRLQQLNEKHPDAGVIQCEKPEVGLVDLYENHDGYVSDKWDLYLQVYDSIFSTYRNKAISLLEIGVQNGGSLEIWSKYFRQAKIIVGCDIEKKCNELVYDSNKIKLVIGDIKSEEARGLIANYSSQYDIIIDDGSHKSSDVIGAFCSLFPILSLGGIYVVEDLHCSYWKSWEGGLDDKSSSVSFFKSLIDLLNNEHWQLDLTMRARLIDLGFPELEESVLSKIHSIKFFNSMCFIEKRSKYFNTLGVRHVVGIEERVCAAKVGDYTFSL